MSFSSEVKEELSRQTDSARHCRIAFLAAMFHLSPVLTGDRAGIRTDQESAAAAFESVLRRVVSCPVEVERSRQGSGGQIRVTVSGKQEVRNLLEMLKLDRGAEGEILTQEEAAAMIPSRLLLQKTCCRRAYLRGAFLLAGSVSDPSKSYHFEIVFQREEDAEMVASLMGSLGFEAKLSTRKKRYLVYLKEGEQISDALGAMGATGSLMKLENARILRDIAGNVNRQVNFETANLIKTAVAAGRQTEDIRFIEETIGIGSLPQSLQQTAMLRLAMPDASLQELAGCVDPPVGRSGINHRLHRLSEIAEDLRRNGRPGGTADISGTPEALPEQ